MSIPGPNIDTCLSYATEKTLERALIKHGLHACRPIIVCNRKGRFTAIFGYSFLREGVLPVHVARIGFLVTN